ncbi:hypothetical protein [Streptomyces lasiicapitis]|uniref:hypothetical protein n=1 Tax=Streptomyces lasiicapitis TaxID=1923961 RepID=UPI0036C17F0D
MTQPDWAPARGDARPVADAAIHATQRREESAGIRHETPEYLRLNGAANDAAAKVPIRHGGTKRGS